MAHAYSYEFALKDSQRVAFSLDGVLAPGAELDFHKPFLPESLVASAGLSELTPAERLTLNHVRGYSYLSLFGLVEEFILPFVLDHARADLATDDVRTQALLNFACEEAKHIQLFKRFTACFERGFQSACEVVGPASAITRSVLGHGPLGVALLILHIEWMTQRHFVDSVHDASTLEPLFKSLLRHHWLEEAQHAKLDTLMVQQLATQLNARERTAAVEEYLELVHALRDLLDAQAGFDVRNLERARDRTLPARERGFALKVQKNALHRAFLGSGMTHPKFLATLQELAPDSAARVRALSEPFCA